MKKFLSYLFVFFLIPIIPIFLFEIFIVASKNVLFSEELLSKNLLDESVEYRWIDSLRTDTILVLAGSSSVRYGLSCSELNRLSGQKERYVNIGMDARDPIKTYFILRNILDNHIKAVYFGLDPWIFAKSYYKHRENYLYLDFSFREVIFYTLEHDKRAILKRYKSLISSYLPNAINKSTEKKVPIDFGSITLERTATNFNQPINEWFQIEKYGWSDLQFIYLKKIEDLCYKNNTKFCLFIPPKRSDFIFIYKEKCDKIHLDDIAKLEKLQLQGCVFSRFDLLEKIGGGDNFTEAYHLNKKGQVIFSRLFYTSSINNLPKFSKEYSWFAYPSDN